MRGDVKVRKVSNGYIVWYENNVYQIRQRVFTDLAEVIKFLKGHYED